MPFIIISWQQIFEIWARIPVHVNLLIFATPILHLSTCGNRNVAHLPSPPVLVQHWMAALISTPPL